MGQSGKWVVSVSLITMFALASCGGGAGLPNEGSSTTTEPAGASNEFNDLTLGEVQAVNFSGSSTTVTLNESSSDEEYLLVLTAANATPGDYTVQLADDLSEVPVSDDVGLTVEEPEESSASQFHQFLREMEEVYKQSDEFEEVKVSSAAGLSTDTSKEAVKSFRVLSSMSSIATYQEVTGLLKWASDDLMIYVDKNSEDQMTDADVQELAHNFEGIALPLERNLFGHESDINMDGHISILMTCVLNQMATSGGIVTGFFFPGDLYQRSSVNPASNAQEIFYTIVPDPEGKCGTPISADFAVNNILPGVLAHEYQHMTSFNQHVFLNRGSPEEPWLNEALSHLSEDLTGFGNENPSRAKLFLAQPSKTAVIPASSPTLAERGASYLFLRYLYEQSEDGAGFLNNLYRTQATGVANLEAAFDGSSADFDELPEFLNSWSVALALSETGVTSDPRYNYQARVKSPETGNFTGVCVRCDTQDGRGTVLGGPVITDVASFPLTASLKATSSQFYRFSNPDGTIWLNGTSGAELTGSLVKMTKN